MPYSSRLACLFSLFLSFPLPFYQTLSAQSLTQWNILCRSSNCTWVVRSYSVSVVRVSVVLKRTVVGTITLYELLILLGSNHLLYCTWVVTKDQEKSGKN